MRFLVDECTGTRVAQWLRDCGHEVFSAYDQDRGASDQSLLNRALAEGWIVITNDSDFGELIFRQGQAHHGVIFLRLRDERAEAKIRTLEKLIAAYSDQIAGRFVTVSEASVRFTDP